MLEELDLANMNIISVPEDMFLDNLLMTNIILKSNYLINLDSDILAYLTSLRKLDLSFNLFMGLSEHFFNEGLFCPKIINYKIRKLAEIDRLEEFVAADFYM